MTIIFKIMHNQKVVLNSLIRKCSENFHKLFIMKIIVDWFRVENIQNRMNELIKSNHLVNPFTLFSVFGISIFTSIRCNFIRIYCCVVNCLNAARWNADYIQKQKSFQIVCNERASTVAMCVIVLNEYTKWKKPAEMWW